MTAPRPAWAESEDLPSVFQGRSSLLGRGRAGMRREANRPTYFLPSPKATRQRSPNRRRPTRGVARHAGDFSRRPADDSRPSLNRRPEVPRNRPPADWPRWPIHCTRDGHGVSGGESGLSEYWPLGQYSSQIGPIGPFCGGETPEATWTREAKRFGAPDADDSGELYYEADQGCGVSGSRRRGLR